jgi:hypothetical protein
MTARREEQGEMEKAVLKTKEAGAPGEKEYWGEGKAWEPNLGL